MNHTCPCEKCVSVPENKPLFALQMPQTLINLHIKGYQLKLRKGKNKKNDSQLARSHAMTPRFWNHSSRNVYLIILYRFKKSACGYNHQVPGEMLETEHLSNA